MELAARLEQAAELVFIELSSQLDRVLPVLQELRRRTRSKLIAVGSARDPQQILRVVHAGSDDYVDADNDLTLQVKEALQRVASSSREPRQQGKIITVTSSSGGTGRSILAANLAFAMRRRDDTCCLCDLDLRRGDLASMLNCRPRHTITDLCANTRTLDEAMFKESLWAHETGVHLLAAPQTMDDVQQVTSEGVEDVMQFARRAFKFVVVDLEDFFHREQFRVLQLSDTILFTIRLDFNALKNARRALDFLQRAGIDESKLQVVANQHGRPRELSTAQAEEALRMKISHFIPDDPRTLIHSLNCGSPAVMGSPRSRFSRAVQQLAGQIDRATRLRGSRHVRVPAREYSVSSKSHGSDQRLAAVQDRTSTRSCWPTWTCRPSRK